MRRWLFAQLALRLTLGSSQRSAVSSRFLAESRKLKAESGRNPRRFKWIAGIVAALVIATFGAHAQGGIELRGNLSANDTEREEGYFAVAQDTVLMVRPGSEMHQWLKQHAGQTVRLVLEPSETRAQGQ
jgi:hypothetical protein